MTSLAEQEIGIMRFAKIVEVGYAHRHSGGHPNMLRALRHKHLPQCFCRARKLKNVIGGHIRCNLTIIVSRDISFDDSEDN